MILTSGAPAQQGDRARFAKPSGDLAADVLAALLELSDVPPSLRTDQFADLARGRLSRVCGPASPRPNARVFHLATLAAVAARKEPAR